ncbi:MAG TPA: flagellar biosynthesis protein FlhB [Dehalococcoidia bacterium]
MSSERTEAPTPRKRERVRSEGRVSHSADLDAAVVLLGAVVFFRVFGGFVWNRLEEGMRGSFQQLATPQLTPEAVTGGGTHVMWFTAGLLGPILGTILVAGLAANLLQTGFLFTVRPLQPRLDHLNPVTGMQRLFSLQGLVNLGKSLAKMVVVGAVVVITLHGRVDDVLALSFLSVPEALAATTAIAFEVAWKAGAAVLVLALADYAFQRWQYSRSIRMTKDELKDEMKQSEGSPEIKSRIRRQRVALLNRTIQATAQADVVVTNPIHYAVALKYDPLTMSAPRVLAKGERLVAQRMKEAAAEHGIPVVENPPLARALYKEVPVGREIPATLYHAVAEVLAFVYRLRGAVGIAQAA